MITYQYRPKQISNCNSAEGIIDQCVLTPHKLITSIARQGQNTIDTIVRFVPRLIVEDRIFRIIGITITGWLSVSELKQ